MSHIRQQKLAFAPWTDPRTRRLPGTVPVTMSEWLQLDDAYAAQMGLRDHLIAERPEAVHALVETARPAAEELFDVILTLLPWPVTNGAMTRPDGAVVALDRQAPLLTLGRLVAEDLCLMQPGGGGEHVMSGAILCFPAGWTLAEKFGRPMTVIHRPVAIYDDDVARRVQRLLDGVRVGQGMMRGTAHHSNAPLHNPRSEAQGRVPEGDLPWLRVERQCLFRLPDTGAVVFSIHTSVVDPAALTAEQAALLAEYPIRHAA